MVLKFLMGVDTYTGNLRYAIDMCMGMPTKRGDWWHFRWTDESGQPLHRTLALVLFVIN
jgi:hypothetical protein